MRKYLVTLLKGLWVGAFIIMLIAVACLAFFGCDNLRMAPTEPQKQIAYQAVVTARAVENEGTDAYSPAAQQLVDATEVSLAYTGVPATPTITDYPTTVAQAGQDAARRPTADEVWSAADGWIDFGIALLGIFGGTAGIAATQFLVKARQKSRALREIIVANEKLKNWYRKVGNTEDLDTFYDFQNAEQTGKTEEIVAAERARLKASGLPSIPPDQIPPMPPVNPPATVKPTESAGE